MNKRFIGIIVLVIMATIGFLYATKPQDSATISAKASNHVTGSSPNNVTLIEYGDFECPACGTYHPVVKAVADKYKDQIFFQFRNYPLDSIHVNARAGSRAAEAAHMQGKFWEMYDILYTSQSSWTASSDPLSAFKNLASQIGITDLTKFENDYKSTEVNDIINADLQQGQKFSITGTPTFILDGKKIDNPQSQADFEKVIEDVLANKK